MTGSFSVAYDPKPARRHILFSYRGRIDRKTYWKWSILVGIVSVIAICLCFAMLTVIAGAARADGLDYSILLPVGAGVLLLGALAASWIRFAILAKRLHDRGRSGWFGLLSLIPIVGQFGVLIYAAGLRGDALPNRYGNPPAPSAKIAAFDVIAYVGGFILSLALSYGVRALIVETFDIPSSSNLPGLLAGDYVMASKYPYLFGAPAPGDMAVFTNPYTGDIYIKRIAGLPGDTVQMVQGVVTVNGKPWARMRIDDYEERGWSDRFDGETVAKRYRYVETLPNGTTHEILGGQIKYKEDSLPQDNTKPVTVPEGHFFAIGDNRDNSADSRLELGTVPLANLLGRAEFCYFSLNPGPGLGIRWSRLFAVVR